MLLLACKWTCVELPFRQINIALDIGLLCQDLASIVEVQKNSQLHRDNTKLWPWSIASWGVVQFACSCVEYYLSHSSPNQIEGMHDNMQMFGEPICHPCSRKYLAW